jgi:hypothetical protein
MADPTLIDLLRQGAKAWNDARARGLVPRRPDLSNADLQGIRLIGVDLDEVDLSYADLTGAVLPYASLRSATVAHANLTRAILASAKTIGADFTGANLSEADLTDSSFDRVNLSGADLRRAKLDRCRLVGASLGQVMTTENLGRAIHIDAIDVFAALPIDRPLSLRFVVDDGEDPRWPRVVILVEGHDVFGLLGHIGFAPSELFSAARPLLPKSPARRIGLYRCYCGEAGCQCVAPVITRVGNEVHWTDFRDFAGAYSTPEVDPQPEGGRALAIPNLRFDLKAYEAAVHRGERL